MPAVHFQEALNAARKLPATADAYACIADLRTTVHLVVDDTTPMLRRVYAALDQELAGDLSRGAFVLAVLGVEPGTLPTCVAIVTSKRISKSRVLELHSDCWAVLSKWVTEWNRRQIRRVA